MKALFGVFKIRGRCFQLQSSHIFNSLDEVGTNSMHWAFMRKVSQLAQQGREPDVMVSTAFVKGAES